MSAPNASRNQATDLADLRAKTPLVPLIGRRVKLTRSGKNWAGCCPFHNDRAPSFYIYPDGRYHCFGCGEHGDAIDFLCKSEGMSFSDALKMLRDEAGLEKLPSHPPLPASKNNLPKSDKSDFACQLFEAALPPQGTIVETYLHFRGCNIPRGGVLRFHPACPRGRDERLPAMLAAMTHPVTNRFVGVHRTFLRADGMGKIDHGTAKMMLGNAGVIRLAPDDEITTGLGICEGIETGLTIIQHAKWSAIWAAGSAGAIANFPVLGGIECLTIFPDCDDKGAGAKAAETCAELWTEAGREVQIIIPPSGKDWNDALAGIAQ